MFDWQIIDRSHDKCQKWFVRIRNTVIERIEPTKKFEKISQMVNFLKNNQFRKKNLNGQFCRKSNGVFWSTKLENFTEMKNFWSKIGQFWTEIGVFGIAIETYSNLFLNLICNNCFWWKIIFLVTKGWRLCINGASNPWSSIRLSFKS